MAMMPQTMAMVMWIKMLTVMVRRLSRSLDAMGDEECHEEEYVDKETVVRLIRKWLNRCRC